jgi:hypothetical protein
VADTAITPSPRGPASSPPYAASPPGSASDDRLAPPCARRPAAGPSRVQPSMSIDTNVSVCVATSPGLLIKVDANRHRSQRPPAFLTGQRKHHTPATGAGPGAETSAISAPPRPQLAGECDHIDELSASPRAQPGQLAPGCGCGTTCGGSLPDQEDQSYRAPGRHGAGRASWPRIGRVPAPVPGALGTQADTHRQLGTRSGPPYRRLGAVIKGLPPGLRSGAGKARSRACVLEYMALVAHGGRSLAARCAMLCFAGAAGEGHAGRVRCPA